MDAKTKAQAVVGPELDALVSFIGTVLVRVRQYEIALETVVCSLPGGERAFEQLLGSAETRVGAAESLLALLREFESAAPEHRGRILLDGLRQQLEQLARRPGH